MGNRDGARPAATSGEERQPERNDRAGEAAGEQPDRQLENAPGWTPGPEQTDRPGRPNRRGNASIPGWSGRYHQAVGAVKPNDPLNRRTGDGQAGPCVFPSSHPRTGSAPGRSSRGSGELQCGHIRFDSLIMRPHPWQLTMPTAEPPFLHRLPGPDNRWSKVRSSLVRIHHKVNKVATSPSWRLRESSGPGLLCLETGPKADLLLTPSGPCGMLTPD